MEPVSSLRFSQQPVTDTYPGLGGISSKPALHLFYTCSRNFLQPGHCLLNSISEFLTNFSMYFVPTSRILCDPNAV
jgi:hypothetical protein